MLDIEVTFTDTQFLMLLEAHKELIRNKLDVRGYRVEFIKDGAHYAVLFQDKTYKVDKDTISVGSPPPPYKPSFSVELNADGKVVRSQFEV